MWGKNLNDEFKIWPFCILSYHNMLSFFFFYICARFLYWCSFLHGGASFPTFVRIFPMSLHDVQYWCPVFHVKVCFFSTLVLFSHFCVFLLFSALFSMSSGFSCQYTIFHVGVGFHIFASFCMSMVVFTLQCQLNHIGACCASLVTSVPGFACWLQFLYVSGNFCM